MQSIKKDLNLCCSVCLEQFGKKTPPYMLPCGHNLC